MRTLARLSLRIQRFELMAVAILSSVVTAAALVVRGRLDGVGTTPSCFSDWFESGPDSGEVCRELVQRFFELDNAEAMPIMTAFAFVPLVSGLLLGVALVAREIETGTAGPAWALAGSRTRWLAGRVLPVLLALVVILGFAAVASEALTVSRQPWVPAGLSFADAGGHGFAIVLRGLAAFALALVVGAVVGRTLPAVIVSATLIAAVAFAGGVLKDQWLEREVVYLPSNVNAYTLPGGVLMGSMSRATDGRVVPDEEAYALAPSGEDPLVWVAENFEGVYAAVPGTEYPRYAMVEGVAVGALTVLAIITTIAVVERRRPV